MRVLVYGDSNSWGTGADGSGLRIAERWPVVMARKLGVELIEDCLPGRTTAHDDPEMGGVAFNGFTHLTSALLAQAPLDGVLIMLGTNDFKARFAPDADKIVHNISQLVDCVRKSGSGPGPWREGAEPWVGVILPPALPAHVDDPNWERCAEWAGGRVASAGLAQAAKAILHGTPYFDASTVICGSRRDPIHFEAEDHPAFGHAIAAWVGPLLKAGQS